MKFARLLAFMLFSAGAAAAQGLTISGGGVQIAGGGATVNPGAAATQASRAQGIACFAFSSPLTCTFSSAVTAGQGILVFAGNNLDTATISMADNCNTGGTSDTYTQLQVTTISGTGKGALYHATVGANTASCTLTFTYSTGFSATMAMETVNNDGGVDASAINAQVGPGTGTNAVTSGNITTTQADYVFAATADFEAMGGTLTAGTTASFVKHDNSATYPCADEDVTQSSAGSIAGTWTYSDNSDLISAVVGIK